MSGNDNQANGPLPMPAWQLWVDGTALPNPGRISIGLVLTGPDGQQWQRGEALDCRGCNNEAELKALIAGLAWASTLGATTLLVRSDSDFVVRHVRSEQSTQVARLVPLIHEAHGLLQRFLSVELVWIPRHRNGPADALARAALGLPAK